MTSKRKEGCGGGTVSSEGERGGLHLGLENTAFVTSANFSCKIKTPKMPV